MIVFRYKKSDTWACWFMSTYPPKFQTVQLSPQTITLTLLSLVCWLGQSFHLLQLMSLTDPPGCEQQLQSHQHSRYKYAYGGVQNGKKCGRFHTSNMILSNFSKKNVDNRPMLTPPPSVEFSTLFSSFPFWITPLQTDSNVICFSFLSNYEQIFSWFHYYQFKLVLVVLSTCRNPVSPNLGSAIKDHWILWSKYLLDVCQCYTLHFYLGCKSPLIQDIYKTEQIAI